MTAAWPATLPQSFLTDGFGEESANNTIESDVSIGPKKVRRRSTSGVRKMSGALMMTTAQYATFRTFVSVTIKDGALTFTFPDPNEGADLLVRLAGSYKVGVEKPFRKIEIELEVMP